MATGLRNIAEWAAEEFGQVDLADRRRDERLIRVSEALCEHAEGALPATFDRASELRAAYRLLESEAVSRELIIAPHHQRVLADCSSAGEFLVIEDTSELDYSTHRATSGLGRIGNDGGRGLLVHSGLALKVDCWAEQQEPEVTVVGLLAQQVWARTMPTAHKRETRAERLARQRESQRWGVSVRQAGRPPAGVSWTLLADREADIYELLEQCRQTDWRLIVRANQPRALLDQDGSLFDAVSNSAALGQFQLQLRSRPARVRRAKRAGQRRRVDRPAHGVRTAVIEVRSCTVRIRGPQRPGQRLAGMSINVVHAREVNPPAGADPIHWVLLTDWPVATMAQAMRVIKAYAQRWLIEEYHKALKTGTGIERSQLTTARRLGSLLAILAVVAVRLVSLKLLARTKPDSPAAQLELGPEVLAILQAKYGQPAEGWTCSIALRDIARLGGYLARKGDGPPGWITLWRGWNKLATLLEGCELARGKRCG